MRWGVIILAMGGMAATHAAAPDREWHTLTIEGQRVGYAWHETRTTANERIDSQVMRVYVSQLQRSSLIELLVEVGRTPSGTPKWIRVQLMNGTEHSGWTGTVSRDGRSLDVVTNTNARSKVALPASAVWPDEISAVLGRLGRSTGSQLRIALLNTTSATVVDATVESTADADAAGRRVRMTVAVPRMAPRVESFWLDDKSRVTQYERSLYAKPLRWSACDRNCNAGVAKPFDLMAHLIVPSPFRIPQSALDGTIRYLISRNDGVPARPPVTGEQDVVADGQAAVVTICKRCGKNIPPTDAERRLYLGSNQWVQTSAKAVQDFVRVNSSNGTPQQIMAQLVDAVRAHMTGAVDFLGYTSATQALASRSGDCGEFAVLLAAAARARGIPTRIAVGLVYSGRFSGKKDVFSPHIWVQAWTGDRWVSYDAGLEGFDATHIALGVSDGDPRASDTIASTGQWRIEKLGLVK